MPDELDTRDRPAHCVGCPWFSICGGPTSNCAYCSCQGARACAGCSVRCRDRSDLGAWLADVGGTLELDDVKWPAVPLPQGLPPFIPILGGPVNPLPDWPAYGVRWERVLTKDGLSIQPRWLTGQPQGAMGASATTATVLTLVGPDPAIEALWTNQYRTGLWQQIRRARFDLVIGPNYSVYGDQPRWEHLINLKRSILAAVRMRVEGIPAVPHVYAWRQVDADRVAAWAQAVNLDAVAHNCQTYGSPREWERALAMLIYLRDGMPAGCQWFFVGAASRDRVQTLRTLFPGCHILSLWPYQTASHGHRITADGKQERLPARPAELLEENVTAVASWF